MSPAVHKYQVWLNLADGAGWQFVWSSHSKREADKRAAKVLKQYRKTYKKARVQVNIRGKGIRQKGTLKIAVKPPKVRRRKRKPKKRDYQAEYRKRKQREIDLFLHGWTFSDLRSKAQFIRGMKAAGMKTSEDRLKETRRALRREAAKAFGIKVRDVREFLGPRKWQEPILDVMLRRAELEAKLHKEVAGLTIDFTDESTFIRMMKELGFSEHEAYTLWFSP